MTQNAQSDQPTPISTPPPVTTPDPVKGPTQVQIQASSPAITQDDALDALEKAILETEAERELPLQAQVDLPPQPQIQIDPGIISQAIPQAVQQAAHVNLNPPQAAGTTQKESTVSNTPDNTAIEAAQAIQHIEQEPSPEIPPEVESYLQKVEEHTEQAPEEIVIADGSDTMPKEHNYPTQPVVVLPITPEVEKKGKRKNPKFSIRWLVEWSHKVMKKFVGKVVYREAPEEL